MAIQQKKIKLILSVFLFFFSTLCHCSIPNINSKDFKLTTIFDADEVIWSFAFLSNHELLITLKKGTLLYYNQKTQEKKKLAAPPSYYAGQGGLLDVQIDLRKGIRYVFLTFSEKIKGVITTSLAKGIFKNQSLENLKTIFRAAITGNSNVHFGSRLLIKKDLIFMTIGDRGKRKFAQDLGRHNGKILRLTLEGKAAKGNPFENVKGALPEIWSLGHRNPQGIDINPIDQTIYSSEFGPRGGDELNIIEKAKNYGWPLTTFGREYYGPKIGQTHKKGMQAPLVYWVPSISPSGMAFYTGDKIKKWSNSLFLANLSGEHLRRLEIKKGQVVAREILFKNLKERFRHVRTGPDGYLYFSTDSGKLVRVEN